MCFGTNNKISEDVDDYCDITTMILLPVIIIACRFYTSTSLVEVVMIEVYEIQVISEL